MNDIPPIKETGSAANTLPVRAVPQAKGPQPESQEDKVEISETGRLLSNLESQDGVRADKVAQIRQAILDGTYEADDKIAATVDRLLEVLRSVPTPR